MKYSVVGRLLAVVYRNNFDVGFRLQGCRDLVDILCIFDSLRTVGHLLVNIIIFKTMDFIIYSIMPTG